MANPAEWSGVDKMKTFCKVLLVCISALWLSGCVSIEQTVVLNKDKSGKIIEVIKFNDQFVQLSSSSTEFASFLDLLKKEERAKERAALFGDVTFTSHEFKDLGAKGMMSRTVFAFEDIAKIAIPAMPHRGANWKSQKVCFHMGKPAVHVDFRGAYYHRLPLAFSFSSRTKGTAFKKNPNTPAEMEKLRSLLPAIRPMLKDFSTTLKIKTFAPIGNSRTHIIYDVRANHLDDDDVLLKLILWNQYPDQDFAIRGKLGYLGGKIMNRNYDVKMTIPAATTTTKLPDLNKKDGK